MHPRVQSASVLSFCALFALPLLVVPQLAAADATVEILPGFVFSPAEVTIQVGEAVSWVNTEGEVHTTTNGTGFEDPEWGLLWDYWFFQGPGEVFTRTFDTPGVYPYFCVPHQSLGMVGTVTVQAPPSANEPSSWGGIKGLFR